MVSYSEWYPQGIPSQEKSRRSGGFRREDGSGRWMQAEDIIHQPSIGLTRKHTKKQYSRYIPGINHQPL
jgi:hypothetical protein